MGVVFGTHYMNKRMNRTKDVIEIEHHEFLFGAMV